MRRYLLGLVPIAFVTGLIGACSHEPARIGLVLETPQSLLGDARSVTLSVFDASEAKCLSTGHVTKIPSGEGTQVFPLQRKGCDRGISWCKDIELEKSDKAMLFAVVAKSAIGTIAEGC